MKNYRFIGLSLAALSLFAFASIEGCTTTVGDGSDSDGGTSDGGTSGTSGTAGTSGDGGASGDGGTSGDSAAGARGTGTYFASYTEIGTTVQSFTATASFAAPTTASATSNCTTTTEGSCTVTDCTITPSDGGSTATDGGLVEPPNAGDIKLTGGGFPSAGVTISVNNDADAGALKGTYTAKTLMSTEPWNATNKNMTVTAAGGTVPAFTKDLVAPLVVTATAPTFSAASATSLPRANDLTVTWTGGTGSGGKVNFSLIQATTTKSISAVCQFDPAGGTGTVKAAVLAKFPAGASASGTLTTTTTEAVAAGNYDVSVVLSSTGKAGAATAFGMFSIP
ncbi:MAG: hypothetical protein U0169_00585 [Polyangiaceae bacterium]